MIRNVSVLGVGLIGGSLCLSFRKYHPELQIIGYDHEEILREAVERGVIDRAANTIEQAVRDADVVFICLPLTSLLSTLEGMAPHVKNGAVISDVGSVKKPVVEQARTILPNTVTFIGGHPMAGSEKGGVSHADIYLFENATYVLCPPAGMTDEDFTRRYCDFVELLQCTGARLIVLDPDRHDRIAAAISHLPQLLAVTLVSYVAELNQVDDAFLRLAAGGFRDMTRIASSPFGIWNDILTYNREQIVSILDGFVDSVDAMKGDLERAQLEKIQSVFDEARRVRDTIPKNSKGFLHPLADIYVHVEDRPGVLFSITEALYQADINIKDIELLKIREGAGGALRLSFSDGRTSEMAVEALKQKGFHAYQV